MSKLIGWKSLGTTVRVETNVPIMPVFYLGKQIPGTSELNAIANKELADGWPSAVVDRARARRTSRVPCWIGSAGMTLGDLPAADICGPGRLAWLRTVFKPKDMRGLATIGTNEATVQSNFEHLFTLEAKLLERATGLKGWVIESSHIDLSVFGTVAGHNWFLGVNYLAVDAVMSRAKNLATSTHMCIVVNYGWHPAYFVVERKPGMEGVDALVYTQTYMASFLVTGSVLNPALANEQLDRLCLVGIACGAGWFSLMQEFDSRLVESNSPGWYAIDNGGTIRVKRFDISTTPVAQLSHSPWSTELGTGPAFAGLSMTQVYHIGDPEFANSVSLLAAPSYDLETRVLSVPANDLYVTWPAERLIEISPDMSVEDQDRLRGKSFCSLLAANPWAEKVKLEDLAVWGMAQEGDMDLANEIFMPAQAEQEAITFAEGVARANAGDRRMYHQMIGYAAATRYIGDEVRFSGSSTEGTLAARVRLGGQDIPGDDGDAMAAIANGARITYDPGTIVVGDACYETFGVSLIQLQNAEPRWEPKDDFNEEKVFANGLPNVYGLPLPKKSALLMMQHGLNRRALSSFVVGALTMAAVARRQLL